MVGLLIVSHSAEVARGVAALAGQMTQAKVPIAASGGTLEGGLGTSADLISQAALQLKDTDGVLVLVDLGSAVMSAETALETASMPFTISNAPLVEGAILAAVEAAIGRTLAEVAAAAERGRELVKVP